MSAATGLESEDQRLLQALTTPELHDIVGLVDVPAFVRDNEGAGQHEGGSAMTTTTPTEPTKAMRVTGAQIAAARLRVLTDEKLGRTTPPVIVQLAQTR